MVATQIIINALIASSIYALIAYGFSLVYSTNKIVHFAQGSALLVAGYSFYALSKHMSYPLAIVSSLIISLLLGILFHYFYLLLQKKKASSSVLLIASFGLLILIESVIQIFFGSNVKTITSSSLQNSFQFLGAYITPLQVIIIATAFLLFVILFLFSNYTKLGLAFKAVASKKDVAQILGIDAKRIQFLSFIFSSIIGCIAGILIALEQNLIPSTGSYLIIKGFTATIIGGIGNIFGSLAGALILGFAENIGVWFLPSGFKDAIAFTLLILFLLIRPKGVFGK